MGPTPFSVGDRLRSSKARASPKYFNGANAIQRWRRERGWTVDEDGVVLQWGQRHSALETGRQVNSSLTNENHFNGANAIQRWRLDHRGSDDGRSYQLQWGQRHSALETRRGDGPTYRHQRGTSMGPTPFSVGDMRRRLWRMRRQDTSMGPTPFSVGDIRDDFDPDAKTDHFNGANAIQRWRPGSRRPAPAAS